MLLNFQAHSWAYFYLELFSLMFQLNLTGLRRHHNRFYQCGLLGIVADCLQCYPTCNFRRWRYVASQLRPQLGGLVADSSNLVICGCFQQTSCQIVSRSPILHPTSNSRTNTPPHFKRNCFRVPLRKILQHKCDVPLPNLIPEWN